MSIKIAILGAGWLGVPLYKHLSKLGLEIDLIQTKDLHQMKAWSNYNLLISTWPKENIQAFHQLPKTIPLIAMSSTSQTESMLKFEEELTVLFSKPTILRLGGLIGYNRHPGKFLSGKKDIKGKNHFINLIHRDDIIQIISVMILQNKIPQKNYNLVSDKPCTKKVFYTYACQEINSAIPEFDELDNSEKPAVDGTDIKKLINYEFIYSSPFDYLKALRERKNNRA
jgi:hypothetical protein